MGDTESRLHSGTLSEALHLHSGWKTEPGSWSVSWKCMMTPQVLTQLKTNVFMNQQELVNGILKAAGRTEIDTTVCTFLWIFSVWFF